MAKGDLSPREAEIVRLSAKGLTNEAIAYKLGVSIGTINTYWLRIKLKTGGVGKTDAVVQVYERMHEREINEERVDWLGLERILDKREALEVIEELAMRGELRTRLAMLQLAMDHIHAATWATDEELCIHLVTNGDIPSTRSGVEWVDGKSIYELFGTEDKSHPAVAAHLEALAGSECRQRLAGDFAGMVLEVVPVCDDAGEPMGSISILMDAPFAGEPRELDARSGAKQDGGKSR